jgi:hypothetical protein
LHREKRTFATESPEGTEEKNCVFILWHLWQDFAA